MHAKASQAIFQSLSITPSARARLTFAADLKRQIEEAAPKEPHLLVGCIEDATEAVEHAPHDLQAFESALCLYRAAAHWYKRFAACPESLILAAWSEAIAVALDKLQAALLLSLPLQPKGEVLPYCEAR